METLVSTRLFSYRPLDESCIRYPRDHGFLSLELFAREGHFDILAPGEARRAKEMLEALGMGGPWVHLDVPTVAKLERRTALQALTSSLIDLGAKAVTLPKRPWSRDGAPMPDIQSILIAVQQAGAKLGLDFGSPKERTFLHPPHGVRLCWDIASAPTEEDAEDYVLSVRDRLHPSMLQGVRVAHMEGGHRFPPTEKEASILEDAWPHLVPRMLIYDVEDPSQGSPAELERIFSELNAFHSGERRPPGKEGGGLFWAGLAPG